MTWPSVFNEIQYKTNDMIAKIGSPWKEQMQEPADAWRLRLFGFHHKHGCTRDLPINRSRESFRKRRACDTSIFIWEEGGFCWPWPWTEQSRNGLGQCLSVSPQIHNRHKRDGRLHCGDCGFKHGQDGWAALSRSRIATEEPEAWERNLVLLRRN